MTSAEVKRLAHECGFELAGIARAEPHLDFDRYQAWVAQGRAGAMSYLADRRAGVRQDARNLLPAAKSIICVGKLYNSPQPYSTRYTDSELGWISRYAWGSDYHAILRTGLEELVARLGTGFNWKICVDTAPLLERSFAREAGLGWIGKNTCLINQYAGSWFFLGELITSLELAPDTPPPDRCGSCTRCIDACPTAAILPDGLDARLCISYFTIELKGTIPEEQRAGMGRHIFGCDICQDVCPWNHRAALSLEEGFAPREIAPALDKLAEMTEQEFREMFRDSPVSRPKYSGFLRNVAIAMGNSRSERFRPALIKLSESPDNRVAEHACWALAQLKGADFQDSVTIPVGRKSSP